MKEVQRRNGRVIGENDDSEAQMIEMQQKHMFER